MYNKISDESSAADNEDSYFADEAHSISQHTPRPTDERGYIVRRDITDAATRPDWLLPPGLAGGVWTMMKQVAHWKPEGWLALWKGEATLRLRLRLHLNQTNVCRNCNGLSKDLPREHFATNHP